MKLEQQVPTLELCKKLKELGYPQEGLFSWWFNKEVRFEPTVLFEKPTHDESCTAPTVAELGKWLLPYINSDSNHYSFTTDKWEESWVLSYWSQKLQKMLFSVDTETEANARAKMLIWLVESGYLEFK